MRPWLASGSAEGHLIGPATRSPDLVVHMDPYGQPESAHAGLMRRLAGAGFRHRHHRRRAIHHVVTMSKQRVNKTAARGDLLPLCYYFSKVAGQLPDTRDEEMIMADNFDTFTHILNEFQKLDGGSARKQAIKALQAMDKNLSVVESRTRTPPSKTRSKRTAGNGLPRSGIPSTRLPPRPWRKTGKNAAPAPHRLLLPRPQPPAKSRGMRDREPGHWRRDAGGRVCFCSNHGSVVNAMKAYYASERWRKPPSAGAPPARRAHPTRAPRPCPPDARF